MCFEYNDISIFQIVLQHWRDDDGTWVSLVKVSSRMGIETFADL